MSAISSLPAMISPQSQSGLLFSGGTTSLVVADGGQTALSPTEASHWIASHEWVLHRNVADSAELGREIGTQSRRAEALDIARVSLDEELSVGLREDALFEFDALLGNRDLQEWLTELFHARPLPQGTPIADASSTATMRGLGRAQAWLRTVSDLQPTIVQSSAAWSQLPDSLVGGAAGRDRLLQLALRQRVFSRVVALLDHGDAASASSLALSELHDVANHRDIVGAWLDRIILKPRSAAWYGRKSARTKTENSESHIDEATHSRRFERMPVRIERLWDLRYSKGGDELAAKPFRDLADEVKSLGLHQQLALTELPLTIDSDLAARVARGDRHAETTFVRRHQRAVALVLQSRVQPDRVYDLAQETFIVVIARMRDNGIHDPQRIGGFLRQTAINLANSDRRKQLRQRTDTDNDSIDITLDVVPGPADFLEFDEFTATIGLLMEELPMQRDRELLRRYLWQGEEKGSLCVRYGLSSEHFDRVLHRARVRLKELLEKQRGTH